MTAPDLAPPDRATQSRLSPEPAPGLAARLQGTLAGLGPVQVALVCLVVSVVFVSARTAVAGGGNIGALIVLGHNYVHSSPYTAGIPVRAGNGYDGQFYFRMAIAPLDWSRHALGVTFDNMGRWSRIAYPALVWLFSAGQPGAAPIAMVVVNVLALAVLAGAAGGLAREVGRTPVWGLAMAAFPGLLWSLGRDLTEVTDAAFVALALLCLRRARPFLAGVSLAGAVLAREPALVLVGAVFVTRALALASGHRRARPVPARRTGGAWTEAPGADLAWAIPAAVFAAWQAAVWSGTGRLPVASSGGHNIGTPFVALGRAVAEYAGGLPHVASVLWLGELAVLGALTATAGVAVKRGALLLHEALAWAGLVVMATLLGNGIWAGNVGFRSLVELWLLGCLAVLAAPWRLRWPAALAGCTWAVVFVELVRFI